MKIGITGGSGFVGLNLSKLLISKGHQIIVLDVIEPKQKLSGLDFIKVNLISESVPDKISDCDAIIHLAGVNIFGRWTKDYKKLILDSRVISINKIIDFLRNHPNHKVKTIISASAVGYYGNASDQDLDESSPNGSDFLAQVCKEWEGVVSKAQILNIRVVNIRTGIVLGPGGGMLAKLIPVFKISLGGPLAGGEQWFSWIHLDDLLNIYELALLDDRLSGPVNATSPKPVKNKEFSQNLALVLGVLAFIPIPAFILRIFLGELSQAIINSAKVLPKKLNALNFNFKYPDIYSALKSSIK